MATVNDRFKVKNGLDIAVLNGTQPIVTESQTLNQNLNADLLDGQHGSYYATDSTVVHKEGSETITGSKLFQSQSDTQTILTIQGAESQTEIPFLVIKTSDPDNILTVTEDSITLERTSYFIPENSAATPLIIESAENQTADLQQWKSDESEVIAKVDKDGHATFFKITTDSDAVINGNLTVNGTTTTFNSVVSQIEDPVLLLGGVDPLIEPDAKDRGIEFRWHDGTSAQVGFIGFDHVTERLKYIPIATNTGEIFAGDFGDLEIGSIYASGDIAVNDGDITTTSETFNLINTNATTLNIGGQATQVDIGASTGTTSINNDLDVDGDVNIDGADLTTNSTSFNLLNTNATTVNFAGAATTVEIGSSTGTTNVNNNLDVDGDVNIDGGDLTVSTSTFNLANTNASTINFGGAATDIQIGSAVGTTNVNNNLDVDGDINVDGGDLTTSSTTFNLLNDTATTVNFAGAATTVEIGSTTGTTNINNNLEVDGDVQIDGGDLISSTSTFNLVNTNATTVNFAGAATDIQIGSSSGITDINNNLNVSGDEFSTTSSGFTLLDTPSVVNFATAATTIEIGGSTGTTNINNNLDVDGDVSIDGGDLIATTPTFNLVNTTSTTINFAGAATDIQIGSTTGTTNVNNNLDVDLDLNVDGGDITTSASTFNLLNTTADVINFGGAATDIQIGSSSGTTNINNNLDVDGDINIDGGDLTASTSTFNLLNSPTTINFGAAATDVQIGAATGITNINNNADIDGNLNVDGGSITTNLTNFNLLKTNVTTLDFAQAATNITMGATTGETIVRHALQVDGNTEFFGATNTFNPSIASTPPFTIGANAFDVLVAGLNADKLDGQTGTWYQARENHTGTQEHTTISDWTEAVQDTVSTQFVHSQHVGVTAIYNDITGRVILTAAGGGGGAGGDLATTYWFGV